ncbi:MAG: sigma-70 family RNA polymerase sigma factor [Bacteroidales bacterium]|nr:sigma-70 family RNA polymerase sigma factor [Bacteroidales bacterium]
MSQEEFKSLIRANKSSIDKVCMMYGDVKDYKDLRQEICCTLWVALRKNPMFEDERRLRSWVFSVALNVGRMHLRKEYTKKHFTFPLTDEVENSVATQDSDVQLFNSVMEFLSGRERVLLMFKLEELTDLEIAQSLNIKESKVQKEWRELVKKIKKQFKK